MNFRRILFITRKEIFHIARDPFTLAMALGLPIIFIIVFGLAIEFNLKEICVAVYDGDHTPSSRALIEVFGSSGYFKTMASDHPAEAMRRLDSERAKAVLIVNRGFERDLIREGAGRVQFLLDGADNSTVGSILSYVSGIQRMASEKLTGAKILSPVKIHTRYLYNPELDSHWFVVPGLMVIVTAILSIFLTSLTVAREWENGSMELLLSTPAYPFEIVIGKLIPYVVLGLLGIVLVYAVARLGFAVPFRGSHFVFGTGIFLFILGYLSQGILISVVTRNQRLAMQIAFVSGLLPSILLSGFVFPIENMPVFFQYLTAVFPARWFMTICRAVFLKGSGFFNLIQPFIALIVLDFVLIMAATKRFKRDVEP